MGKRAALATILLFLIVADVASATPLLWNFRRLVSSAPNEKSDGTVSPNPSPAPNSGDESSKDKQLRNKTPPPVPAKKDKEREKKKDETKANEPSGINETCDLRKQVCKDTSSMVACVQVVDEVNKVMVVLIQNDGEHNLKVNIRTSSLKMLKDEIQVPKHHSQKTNISLNDDGTQILLNAGSGDCTLQLGVPVSKGDFPEWIPSSYTELMTPIYGAYFLILVTIVALGVFACCKFRSKRQDEIPYQELEMGETQETTTSVDVEAADGWDQGWDDDWDDDKAINSPGGRLPEIVSANGHSSKSPNGDGWEDWDD